MNKNDSEIDLSFIKNKYFRKQLENYILFILNNAPNLDIKAILLFGSLARGDETLNQNYTSDIDLIVVSDTIPDDLKERRKKISEITKEISSDVQTLWWTSEEIKANLREKFHLLLDALDEGKILYDKNNLLHSLRKKMFIALANKGVVKTDMYWQWPIKKFGDKIEF
jgi:predicted nucleotidyltransferase